MWPESTLADQGQASPPASSTGDPVTNGHGKGTEPLQWAHPFLGLMRPRADWDSATRDTPPSGGSGQPGAAWTDEVSRAAKLPSKRRRDSPAFDEWRPGGVSEVSCRI
jgi:hypothetical protein